MGIPYGKQNITLDIKENNVKLLLPNEKVIEKIGFDDEKVIIDKALENSLFDYSLSKWLINKRNIVILIPDITRNCSVDIYMDIILKYLNEMGFDKSKVKIIIATGNHRPCSESEIKELVGESVYNNYSVNNHNSMDNLIYMGTSDSGNKIYINKDVYEADGIIATGNITYHNFAGFSGGRKIILPGVCGKETIIYNHKLMVHNNEMCDKCQIGILKGNPIHEDMKNVVKLLDKDKTKIYSLNVITNMYGEIIEAFSGRIEEVFEKGTEYVEKNYCINVRQKGDLVICSAGGYPYDLNFYQSFKSLYSANRITKDNGNIILFSECYDGLGESYEKFKYWFKQDINDIVNNLSKNFDVVGQIAYWTKNIIGKKNLTVITRKENSSTFKSIGIKTLDETEGKNLLKELITDENNKISYLIPYANIINLNSFSDN